MIPPPLPPHGITANSINVEYRPPVPPHRNIGVTANMIGQLPPAQGGQRVSCRLWRHFFIHKRFEDFSYFFIYKKKAFRKFITN